MYQTDQQRRLAPAEFPPSPCEEERGAGAARTSGSRVQRVSKTRTGPQQQAEADRHEQEHEQEQDKHAQHKHEQELSRLGVETADDDKRIHGFDFE